MCKRNSPDKNGASMGCVGETPQKKRKNKHGMCERSFPDKKEKREPPPPPPKKKKKKKKVSTGYARQLPV